MLAVSEQGTQVDKDWREAPLKSLVEHLVRDHRSWRAKDFPLIQELFDRLEETAESIQPSGLESLRRAFYRLRAEMEGHMSREENVLFPAIVHAESHAIAGSAGPRPNFGSMQNPITMLEHDHDHENRFLAVMRDAAHDYHVPEGADENLRTLFGALQALEAAMHAHTRIESSILFARALQLSRGKSGPLADFDHPANLIKENSLDKRC
jgi:regulator of cell morphogenesis and NO signaling